MEENPNDDGDEDDAVQIQITGDNSGQPRADSQLRHSQNAPNGMEGFEGIVGISAAQGGAGKRQFVAPKENPKSAAVNKKDLSKPKKPGDGQTGNQEKKEQAPPLSLGVFGSGMQKK